MNLGIHVDLWRTFTPSQFSLPFSLSITPSIVTSVRESETLLTLRSASIMTR